MRKTLGSIGRNAVGGLALLTLVAGNSGCVPTATGRNNLNLLGSIATNALIDEGVRDAVRSDNQNVQPQSQVYDTQVNNKIGFLWFDNPNNKEKYIMISNQENGMMIIIDDEGNFYYKAGENQRIIIPEGKAVKY